MNNSMPVQPGYSRKQDFPLRLFAAAFVISLLSTVFSGWQMWQMHHRVAALSEKRADLVENVGSIMLFDEVLTMSARMAAATGDFSYEQRYNEFDRKLTTEINKVRALLPQAEIALFVRETDDANNALVKMERQAFALAHQGKRQEATALLTSTEYLRLKKVYSGGMEKIVNAATSLVEREDRYLDSLSFWLVVTSALSILVLLATWFFAFRSARSVAVERKKAEDALREVYDGLEVLVEQRTADLSGANEQLRHEISERKQAEEKIRTLNEELEAKVQERTRQLLAAQEELVRKEKLALLGQVADTVGHELRNPLGVMNNAVYFLQAVLSDADETIKEYLGIIKDEIADAERIVSDLLDAVRIKPPRPEVVDIADVIDQTLRKCDIPPSVTVSLDIPATLSTVRADPMHLHQIFWNLITNSLEAMAQGGTLAIRVEEEQIAHTLRISVQDSGIGITSEQQAKLFQPLFTTKVRRIGLGLVVVKNLAQVNGGSVAMESYPGEGSTFTVTLPGRS